MKLLFMDSVSVNYSLAQLMCIDYLGQYYPYEVWDLSRVFHTEGLVVPIDASIFIDTLEDFESKIAYETQQDSVLIISSMVIKDWGKLYKIAKKYKVKIICTQKNNYTDLLDRFLAFDFSIKMPLRSRIRRILQGSRLFRTARKIKKCGFCKYDYLISYYNAAPEETRHFVSGHNVKYDEFLFSNKCENPIGHKFILFLDGALCYHAVDFNIPDPVFDIKHYLTQLNEYFDRIETKYNLPVVISLHPCSANKISSSDFNGREVTYGMTAQLIQHSEFVISHFTTSLITVVLAGKADIVITSKEIEASVLRYRPQVFGFAMAKKCGFAIDSMDYPKLPIPKVDSEKYQQYIEKYLVNTEKKGKTNGQILQELINSL